MMADEVKPLGADGAEDLIDLLTDTVPHVPRSDDPLALRASLNAIASGLHVVIPAAELEILLDGFDEDFADYPDGFHERINELRKMLPSAKT